MLEVFLIVSIYVVFNSSLKMFISEKVFFEVKLPKKKIFKDGTKVTPIYKLSYLDFHSTYHIQKYELLYKENKNGWFFIPFCIIPVIHIKWMSFGYVNTDEYVHYHRRSKEEVLEEIGEEKLSEFFERKKKERNEILDKERQERSELENRFGSLNRVFNENYEK